MTKVVHLYASQRVSRRAKDGIDGTSVTIISKSVTYQISASGTETPTGNWSDKVVATTDTKPYLWTRTIVVYSDTNSTTSYSVSYKGKDGAPGKDAYRVEVSPSTLVFDTNEDGVVDRSALSGKYATVTVYKGSQKISVDNLSLPSNYATKKYTNVDGRIYNTNGEARITITEIEQETISGDEKVSKSSGQISFPIDVFGERSTLMWVTVNVQVNVAKFTGSVVANNKKFETKFTEISNRFENTPTNQDLTDAESRITQTAREISLSVSEKVIGRRNLLVNSAFRNQDSVLIHSLARIEKNTGVDGVNCIHSSDKYSGTGEGNYIGAFWDSTQKNGFVTNIPIVKGKKYVFSCWIKSDNLDLPFIIECLYMKSINQQSRDNVDGAISVGFKVREKNKWEKISCVLDTNNEKATEYLAVNFWSNNKNVPKVTDVTGATYYPTCHAYICKPMMEEGDTYKGWSRSPQDYDYVGGNMIDNARTLEVGGSLKSINTNGLPDYERAYYGDCMALRIKNTNANNTYLVMEFATDSMELDVDYIFSFLAKGKASIGLYAQCDRNAEGDSVFSEDSVNQGTRLLNVRYASIIEIPNQLMTEYKRYWGHMRFHGYLPSKLYIQLNGAGEVYVCQPKLEKGATMTEFTERKTDLVDKASLKAAGIEITSDQVILYGNKVQVKTPKANPSEGYDEAAMFQNGKLNAKFINAGDIVAKGINAQEINATKLNITGDSKIGIWSINEDSEWGKIMVAKNTKYQGTTIISGIQYCPLFIRGGIADIGEYFRVGVYCTEFSYKSGASGFNAVWLGSAAKHACRGSGSNMGVPIDYSYNNSYEPAQYIYSVQENKDSPALAICVNAANFAGTPTAIKTNGAIRGVIAPNLRTMNFTQQISISDNIVVATASNITLTLPPHPVTGQTLIIFTKATNVYIQCNGTEKMYANGKEQTKIEIGRAGNFTYFFFDGTNWCYSYFDGSHNSK